MTVDPRDSANYYPETTEQPSTNGTPHWVQLPSGIFVNKTPETQPEENYPKHPKQKKRPAWKNISVWLTTIIAASTLVQTCNTNSNNISTSKQVERMLIAGNRVDDAADSFSGSAAHINNGVNNAVVKLQAQAEQATNSIRQSREQFIQDQRPYLWLTDSEPSQQISVRVDAAGSGSNSGKLAFDFWIKNYGKSPAIRVHSSTYVSTGMANPEDDIQWAKFAADLSSGAGGIYPSGDLFFKTGRSADTVDPRILIPTHVANPATPPIGALHVFVVYFDQSGNRYTSEMCELFRANQVMSRCKDHNNLQ